MGNTFVAEKAAFYCRGRGSQHHPPLEGEGRSRSERGGVAKSSSAVPAAHPTPASTALRALLADPPPSGEGEESGDISYAVAARCGEGSGRRMP